MGCDAVYRIDSVPIGAAARRLPAVYDGTISFFTRRDGGLLDVINAVLVAGGGLVGLAAGHPPVKIWKARLRPAQAVIARAPRD